MDQDQTANPVDDPIVVETVADTKPVKPAKKEKAVKDTNKPSNTNGIIIALLAGSLILSTTSFALSIYNYYYPQGTGSSTFTISNSTDGNSANFTEGSIADVASKVSPAVVSIVTEVRYTNYWGQSSSSSAAGTGMIATSDGYVITNKHVIEDARSISVILADGTSYDDVKVVATDSLNDVAFLKIKNVSDLPTVTLGDSKTISVGQQVITIGNALGEYQNTVASGIISGTGRSLVASDSTGSNSETLTDMIQTDAAINQGNSGGPLVNAAGQVIGINTATSTTANSIGFAIPIAAVKGMLKSIIANGSASRAYIGVQYATVTPSLAKEEELPVNFGAYVSKVVSGSPAEKAGIKSNDILTAVNGVKIGSAGSLSTLVGEYSVGDSVQITLIRDSKELTVTMNLEAYTSSTSSSSKN